jgi:hypothetical protein
VHWRTALVSRVCLCSQPCRHQRDIPPNREHNLEFKKKPISGKIHHPIAGTGVASMTEGYAMLYSTGRLKLWWNDSFRISSTEEANYPPRQNLNLLVFQFAFNIN